MRKKKTYLGIIEDNLFLAKTYEFVFAKKASLQIVFNYNSFEEVVACLEHYEHEIPHVIILDLNLKDKDGTDLVPLLKKKFPEVRIIVVSASMQIEMILKAFRMGAHAYISKNMPVENLERSIDNVLKYNSDISPDVAHLLMNHRNDQIDQKIVDSLSHRELHIALAMAKGKSYKDLAGELSISIFTVNYHLKNIYRKLNIKSKSELAAMFFSKAKRVFY